MVAFQGRTVKLRGGVPSWPIFFQLGGSTTLWSLQWFLERHSWSKGAKRGVWAQQLHSKKHLDRWNSWNAMETNKNSIKVVLCISIFCNDSYPYGMIELFFLLLQGLGIFHIPPIQRAPMAPIGSITKNHILSRVGTILSRVGTFPMFWHDTETLGFWAQVMASLSQGEELKQHLQASSPSNHQYHQLSHVVRGSSMHGGSWSGFCCWMSRFTFQTICIVGKQIAAMNTRFQMNTPLHLRSASP